MVFASPTLYSSSDTARWHCRLAGREEMNEKPLVHVIDGDNAVRDSIAMLLQLEGFAVHLYPSGAAFFREADLAAASCLVIDMRLPGLTGSAILELLHSWGIPVRVVAMTNIADRNPCSVEVSRDALPMGSVALEKPFSGQDLLHSIKLVTCPGGSAEGPMVNITAERDRFRLGCQLGMRLLLDVGVS